MQNNKNKFQFWSTYIIYAALWLGISVSAAAEKIKTQETDAFEDTVKTDTELSIDIVKQTQPPNHTNNYGARLPQDSGEIATIEAISAYFADARRYAELAHLDLDDLLNDEQQRELQSLESEHRGKDLDAQMAHITALASKLNAPGKLLVRDSDTESKTARQLKRMRDEDGENAAVLYLVDNDERFTHLLITADGPVARHSNIDPSELNQHIVGLRQALRPDLSALKSFNGDQAGEERSQFWQANKTQLLEHSQWLYNHLLSPIEAAITASGADSLVIHIDGPLRYIPMAVLHDGEQYLIERFALARLVGSVEDALQDVDNVFERPTAAFGTNLIHHTVLINGLYLDPFSSVEMELELVAGDTGRIYFNERFTLRNFLKASQSGDHSALHIATHCVQRPGPMANSFWIFGAPEDNPSVGLESLLSQWQPNNVEMLTLSSCSTAPPSLVDRETNGPEQRGFPTNEIIGAGYTGAEIESFAGVALRPESEGGKDIDTVVTTVLAVNDTSTVVFMHRFYLNLANPDYTRAQALQQTQLEMLNNQLFEDEKERGLFDWLLKNKEQDKTIEPVNFETTRAIYGFSDYSHPHFWAPFIMMGKWR